MVFPRALRAPLLALLLLTFGGRLARAGGGPENVFLVVNSASWASLTLANHFVQLRQIPALNVHYIEWTGDFESIDGAAFRDRILVPTLDTIERRGLLGQIDYIIYSSDFPYSIDMSKEFSNVKFTEHARPVCSINSATYMWHLVMAHIPMLMDLHVNHYMRLTTDGKTVLPTHGFHSWYGWGSNGELVEAGGQPYMLSTVLGITSGRGNSVREALAYLRASASADGTQPKGTIFYSKTADIRSETRAGGFVAAVEALKKLGVKAEIITSPMPGGADVQGAMTGVADFTWPRARDRILPGAICDNFTSFGGNLGETSTQTPLTEFLRYGAAGSSGTVVEPYALWEKFPSPNMQVHYARGCSLAESFYQSVFGPAQLLIVGDPLSQPWANIAKVQVDGVTAGEKVSGTLVLKPSAKLPKGGRIDRFELFVDGRRTGSVKDGESLTWDTTAQSDGYHDLRMVAIEASAIESQGRTTFGVVIENQSHSATLTTVPAKSARWDENLKVRVSAPGMNEILVHANGRELGKISGEDGEIEINPRRLGLGPIVLYAIAQRQSAARDRVAAAPVSLIIEPTKALPALPDPPQKLANGLVLKLPKGKVVPIQETRDPSWLSIAGIEPEQPFIMQGYFDVDVDDVYQFQLWHYGELKLSLDGKTLYEEPQGTYAHKIAAAALAKGKHRLTISGHTGAEVKLRILFGGPGAKTLDGRTFRHARTAQ